MTKTYVPTEKQFHLFSVCKINPFIFPYLFNFSVRLPVTEEPEKHGKKKNKLTNMEDR